MNFELYPSNFQLNQPLIFQTADQQAKAQSIFEFVFQQLQTNAFMIGYQTNDNQQGYLDPNNDLNQFFQAQAQLFIVLADNQVQPAPQGVPLAVYIQGEETQPVHQEYVNPNLTFGEYLIQLKNNQNISATTFILYDQDSQPLTSDPNIQVGTFMQCPVLNLLLQINQQVQQQDPQQLLDKQQQYVQPLIANQINTDTNQQQQIGVQAINPLSQTIDQKISSLKESIKILKNFTLYFDPSGEFVYYKFHLPVLINGSIKKSQSTQSKKFSNSKYEWQSVYEKKFEYAEISEYGFAIKWEGGTTSSLSVKQQ